MNDFLSVIPLIVPSNNSKPQKVTDLILWSHTYIASTDTFISFIWFFPFF